MADQFNHKYELEFGQPISFYGANSTNPSTSRNTFVPISTTTSPDVVAKRLTPESSAVKLTQHNMSFRVTKGKDATTDNEIVIYNISDNVRKFLEANNGNKPIILLKAGYETDQNLPLIFSGEVIHCIDTFNGTTRTTTLTVTSGTTAIQEAYSVKSYRKGTTGDQIIRDVIKDLKLPEGTIYIPESMYVAIQKPVSYTGPSMEFLRKLGKDNNFKVYVEDGTINVVANDTTDVEFVPNSTDLAQLNQTKDPKLAEKARQRIQEQLTEFRKKVPRKPVSVFKISSDNNMIGSPSVKTADASQTEKLAGNRQNVTVTSTLNGAYSIGARVVLESKYHNGIYEIESITHSGTFEGTDWQSTLELKPVSDYEVKV